MITQFRITKQEFQKKELEIVEALQNLNIPQLLAVMGIANAYAWAALERNDAMQDGRINPNKIAQVILSSRCGEVSIEMTNLYLSKYLKKNWPGACSSEHSCRQVRQMMSTMGWKTRTNQDTGELEQMDGLSLLCFTPKLSGSTVLPPTLERMDIAGIAILYRCAFRIWREKTHQKYPDANPFDLLPDHKGMLMVTLFDAIFLGMIEFGVDGFERPESAFSVESVIKSSKKFVMWFFDESYKICRRGWRKLIKREFDQREREYQQSLDKLGVAF